MLASIGRGDILPPEKFKTIRETETKRIIQMKNRRRVSTKTFSFLFENRDTVLNQINEMIFIEDVHDEEEISRLLEVYNELLPQRHQLSVSMFIEIEDEKALVRELPKLAGIERTVYLTFDGHEVHAAYEEGRSTDVLESTVQYLKFNFNKENLTQFLEARNVYIETRKENYFQSAKIPESLLEDLKREVS
ncbi:MAG TPA: DUF3501 family protein [Thermoplasmataceae archaeon]|nr:DUF3501 family protein [Thermoplasmatales archaeon AK]HLH86795.1 DUF3501 family protein [Thermoplasmataceae archaeon]